MKKYLIPETGKFYKANLHSHSTMSDGRNTPEELKMEYQKKGYSVFAYTDHNVMIPHHELTDENFVALTGVEVDVTDPVSRFITCHLCFIALKPDNEIQPCKPLPEYLFGKAVNTIDMVKFDETLPPYKREYTPESINEMIQIGRDKGFFVTYNHPTWSHENFDIYMKYEGMNAMEIVNFGAIRCGYDEHNGHVYDDMLRGGKKLYCIATDDNHFYEQSFGGFTMIKADKLEYRTITKALEDGSFYASEGPIINELWVEENVVHITFEPAKAAYMSAGGWRTHCYEYDKNGGLITEAAFPIEKKHVYFRLTVEGPDGKCAYTNAYYVDDILDK